MTFPLIAITMGDPAGIGSEIIVKTLSQIETYAISRPMVVGAALALEDACRITHRSLKINRIAHPLDGKFQFGMIDVIDLANVDMSALIYGQCSAECGKAAGEYIEKAIHLALAKEVDAIVTAPIHKRSFVLGGWGKKYAGHTEMFADLTHTAKYTMMLAHGDFRVVHVSTHISLAEACRRVKKDRVLEVIRIAHSACKDLGITAPRIGVAGLNPHASEGGLFGREDLDEIEPAVKAAQEEGILAEGPVAPDTLFSKARGGMYDIAVAMYHDQGHIPLKVAGFEYNEATKTWKSVSGVNVTLGLPIIRVSVDHGTAFGKAGKGCASAGSLNDAIRMAVAFANGKLQKVSGQYKNAAS